MNKAGSNREKGGSHEAHLNKYKMCSNLQIIPKKGSLFLFYFNATLSFSSRPQSNTSESQGCPPPLLSLQMKKSHKVLMRVVPSYPNTVDSQLFSLWSADPASTNFILWVEKLHKQNRGAKARKASGQAVRHVSNVKGTISPKTFF